MKKLICIIAAAALTSASVLPCYAADDNRNTTVSTDISPSYIVSIPTDLSVPFNQVKTDLGSVSLDTAQLEPDKCVNVALTTDNKLENKADSAKTLAYSVLEGTAENTGAAFTSAQYLKAGDKTNLTVEIKADDWNKAYAGEYSDTVTVTISYADIA